MPNVDDAWPYFTIDVPGLTRSGADRLLDCANQEHLGVGGWVVEPEYFYTRHLDVWIVRVLRKAAEIALMSGNLKEDEAIGLSSQVEDFTEWLNDVAIEEEMDSGADGGPTS
jgi:hypothetical protein